jgi:hypothetical protein
MQRIFGALAIFGGWMSLPLSAVLGLVATEGLGLYHTEGVLPPDGVYGFPAILVLWVVIIVAVVALVPAGAAMVAPDPSRRVYLAAVTMAVIGVVLLPDELGRAFGLPILLGAGLLALGGRWLHEAGEIEAPQTARPETIPAPERRDSSPTAFVAPPAAVAAPSPTAAPAPASTSPAPASQPLPLPVPPLPAESGGSAGKKSKGRSARASTQPTGECPWCSAPVAAGVDQCPSCGAALTDTASGMDFPIAGVTAVAPELVAYAEKAAQRKKKTGLLSRILDQSDDRIFQIPTDLDRAVVGPPSAEVRAEMERLDREIAAARGTYDPTAGSAAGATADSGSGPDAGGPPPSAASSGSANSPAAEDADPQQGRDA